MGCQQKGMKPVEFGFHANVAQEADLATKTWGRLAREMGSLASLHDIFLVTLLERHL